RKLGRHVAHADARVEHRRMRTRRHFTTLGDRHALPGNGLLLHHERDEAALWALRLDPPQLLGAGEVLLERTGPAEPGRDRIRFAPDVVAVQRIADLEAEAVARSETAGLGAPLEDAFPERRRVIGHHQQLDTHLARVAGAVDHTLDVIDRAVVEG